MRSRRVRRVDAHVHVRRHTQWFAVTAAALTLGAALPAQSAAAAHGRTSNGGHISARHGAVHWTSNTRGSDLRAAHAAACPAVQFIGARGSGETPSQDYDYGPTIWKVEERLHSHGVSADEPLKYEAINVEWTKPDYYTHGYHHSVLDGIDNLDGDISRLVAACPNIRIVLAGYSQGAQVVGDAYQQHMNATDRAHVIGIAMLGDPRFNGQQGGAMNVGSYQSSLDGVVAFTGSARAWPRDQENMVRSYCSANDPICGYKGLASMISCKLHKDCAHFHYMDLDVPGTSIPYTTAAADFLLARIRDTDPAPAPPTPAPPPTPPAPVQPAITFDGAPGTGAPPATLGPYTMQPFAADTSDEGTDETAVGGPTGAITFDSPLQHDYVGDLWQTWSNDYAGDVYEDDYNTEPDGTYEITVTLPPGTGAFYAYAEPDIFEDFDLSATAQDGTTSGATNVFGNSGAQYFGFYASCGNTLDTVTFTDSPLDGALAIGEFGIAPASGC
jgi:hypothetical protein